MGDYRRPGQACIILDIRLTRYRKSWRDGDVLDGVLDGALDGALECDGPASLSLLSGFPLSRETQAVSMT
jgi:hypothetical protein